MLLGFEDVSVLLCCCAFVPGTGSGYYKSRFGFVSYIDLFAKTVWKQC